MEAGLLQDRRANARVGIRNQKLHHRGQSRRIEAAESHGNNAALRSCDSQRARRARNSIRIQRADHRTATATAVTTLTIVNKRQELCMTFSIEGKSSNRDLGERDVEATTIGLGVGAVAVHVQRADSRG